MVQIHLGNPLPLFVGQDLEQADLRFGDGMDLFGFDVADPVCHAADARFIDTSGMDDAVHFHMGDFMVRLGHDPNLFVIELQGPYFPQLLVGQTQHQFEFHNMLERIFHMGDGLVRPGIFVTALVGNVTLMGPIWFTVGGFAMSVSLAFAALAFLMGISRGGVFQVWAV